MGRTKSTANIKLTPLLLRSVYSCNRPPCPEATHLDHTCTKSCQDTRSTPTNSRITRTYLAPRALSDSRSRRAGGPDTGGSMWRMRLVGLNFCSVWDEEEREREKDKFLLLSAEATPIVTQNYRGAVFTFRLFILAPIFGKKDRR